MKLNCPSCNAPIDTMDEDKVILSCGYCNSIVEKDGVYFNKIWEQTAFLDIPTQYNVMQEYPIWKTKFFVKGIVRYEYDWGYFDRFCVRMNNWDMRYIDNDDWLESFKAFSEERSTTLDYRNYVAWESIIIDGDTYFIEESWYCTLDSMKGIFDQKIMPNTEMYYLDLVSESWSARLEYIVSSRLLYVFKEDKLAVNA